MHTESFIEKWCLICKIFTILSNPPAVIPQLYCDVHLFRSPWPSQHSPKAGLVHLPHYIHYGRLWVFLFKIHMHVKTVEMSCFAIKIIISSHILSFEKFENWQKIFLILLIKSQFFNWFNGKTGRIELPIINFINNILTQWRASRSLKFVFSSSCL